MGRGAAVTAHATPMTAGAVRKALRAHANRERARGVARYFKTGPGEYGDGDVFIGVTVPAQRAVARACRDLPLSDADALLASRVHEERLTALLILVDRFSRADTARRRQIFRLYTRRLRFVNNWDLVDTSAPGIVGGWLADPASGSAPPHPLLTRLARSGHLWSRRIAMLATSFDIARGNPREAIRIATILVDDPHDLIQKAVGWMLREVGKRASADALDRFLARHAATMPRTTLRYAIERMPARDRQRWMERRRAITRGLAGGDARG
ncbi:MAG TPA: DNA alkylation repair protein [Vicinamibacterales bacterium]|nr:DNA alkylation repair protein [Vicinamibacterales bacterium]